MKPALCDRHRNLEFPGSPHLTREMVKSLPTFPSREALCPSRTAWGRAGLRRLSGCLTSVFLLLGGHIFWPPSSFPHHQNRMGRSESKQNCLTFCFIRLLYYLPLVTGEIYEFNSKTGARRWKGPLTQLPNCPEPGPQPRGTVAGGQ